MKIRILNFNFYLQEFLTGQNRPKSTRITRLIQGHETRSFKSNFDSWPSGSATPGNEEGRGKVAGSDHFLIPKLNWNIWSILLNIVFCTLLALLKQQGVGVKGMTKGAPVNEEVPPLLEGCGKTEV